VAVADTGCGISDEESERIFEYLYQASNTSDIIEDSRKGLGIGLYICKELVSRHGGRIWVESKPGEGSTFYFTLPVYSLVDSVRPILTPQNLRNGSIGIITVEVFTAEKRPLGKADEKILWEVWKVLGYCSLPDRDVVLPRIGRLEFGEVFFVVACSTREGTAALVRRIQGQVSRLPDFQNGDLNPLVSYKTVKLPEKKPFGHLQKAITSRIEALVKTEIGKRRDAHDQTQDSDRGRRQGFSSGIEVTFEGM
jgi:hypothetical protein